MIKKTNEQFLQNLYNVHGNKYTPLELYKGSNIKINIKCNICNNNFLMRATELLKGHNCPICAQQLTNNKLRKTNEQFLQDLYNIHNNTITAIDKYINNQIKIKFKCNICNHEWYATPANILNKHGCPKCAMNKPIIIKSNIDFYNKLQNIHYGNYIALNSYINNDTKIKIKCNVCNYHFEALPLEILNTHGVLCDNCKKNYINKPVNNNYSVYYIQDTKTKKPIYVGITNNVIQRFARHFQDPSDILYQFHDQNWNELFQIQVIKNNISYSLALDIETKLIHDFLNQNYQLYNKAKTTTAKTKKNNNISKKKYKIKCIETDQIFNSITEAMRQYNISYKRLLNACTYGDSAGIDNNMNPLHWVFEPFKEYIIKHQKTNTIYALEEYDNQKQQWIPFYVGITTMKLKDRLISHYINTANNNKYNIALYNKLHSKGKQYFNNNIRITAIKQNIINRQQALQEEKKYINLYKQKYNIVNIR